MKPSTTRRAFRPIQITLAAVAAVALLGACSETPLQPQTAGAARPAADVAADMPEYVDRLGADGYRYFTGASGGGGLAAALSASRARPASFSLASSAAGPTDYTDVMVSDPAGPGLGQSEVDVAAIGDVIVAAWNDAKGFTVFNAGLSGYGVSVDGGRTFTDGGSFPRTASPTFRRIGDPALAAAKDANLFYFADLCLDGNITAVCVTRGTVTAGGVTWGAPVFAVAASRSAGFFIDKEFIATNASGTDVYVSYTRFGNGALGFGQIEVVASHDGGATWGAPTVVGAAIPGTVQQGSEPALGPDGKLYVVWVKGWQTSLTPSMVARTSTDGGATFGPLATVATFGTLAFTPPIGFNRSRISDFPRIDVATTGRYKGTAYVVYHSRVGGNADVYVTRSADGTSWSTPARLNDVTTDAQFFPVVFVEPGGNIDAIWYDRRNNTVGQGFTDVYWTQSTDGGVTWRPNERVTDVATNWRATVSDIRPNFGDYIGMATSGNRTYAAWGDGRNGNPDVFFSLVRGAGKSSLLAQVP